MCNICGFSLCQCDQTYNYNWYNTVGLPCTTCSGATICKKKVPAKCTIYNGAVLPGLDLDTNIDVEIIIPAIDVAINNLQIAHQTQLDSNAAILSALNDINTRLNALESGADHDPYTI